MTYFYTEKYNSIDSFYEYVFVFIKLITYFLRLKYIKRPKSLTKKKK